MNETDLRVIKSKQNIKNAFLQLMKEKGYQAITVKDIAQKAMINRKTFYCHYDTKEALYNEIANEITEIIKPDEILSNIKKSSKKVQRDLIRHFLSEIKKKKEICTVFFDDNTNPNFNNIIRQKLSDALLSETEIMKRTEGTEFTFKFLTDAYFSIFKLVTRWWLDSKSDNPDDAIDLLFVVFSKAPLEMLGIKYD